MFYRIPQTTYERWLPLVAAPRPRRTVRVGLVVHHHLEPELPARVIGLIRQLAVPARGPVAERALRAIGGACFPWLERGALGGDPALAGPCRALLAQLDARPSIAALLEALRTATGDEAREKALSGLTKALGWPAATVRDLTHPGLLIEVGHAVLLPTDPLGPGELGREIAALGARRFARRERAERALRRRGHPHRAALRRAYETPDQDLERRRRLGRILEQLDRVEILASHLEAQPALAHHVLSLMLGRAAGPPERGRIQRALADLTRLEGR